MPNIHITATAPATFTVGGALRSVRKFTSLAASTYTLLNHPRRVARFTTPAVGTFVTLNGVHGGHGISGIIPASFRTAGSFRKVTHIKATAANTFTTLGAIDKPRRNFNSPATITFALTGTIRFHQIRITGYAFTSFTTRGGLNRPVNSYSLPEDRRTGLGYRPFTPLLVYVVGVVSISDIPNIPDGGSFLLSPLFLSDGAPTFYQRGGRANYVGTKKDGAYFFRPPLAKEIVWQINIDAQARTSPGSFYKYDGVVWEKFAPYGYRALLSQIQYVANQLDPTGAIRYYGQILGAIGAELGQDNIDLAAITDPDSTPSRYLLVMADALGVDITELTDADDAERRRRVRSAVSLHRNKGTIVSAVAAIREAGFIGRVDEMWPNPTAGTNWTDWHTAPANIQAYITSNGLANIITADSGLKGTDLIARPHNYDNLDPTTYFPGSRVIVHINNLDSSPVTVAQQSVFNRLVNRLKTYCLPAHVNVRDFVTDVNSPNEVMVIDDSASIVEGDGPPPVNLDHLFIDTSDDGGDDLEYIDFTWSAETATGLLSSDHTSTCAVVWSGGIWTVSFINPDTSVWKVFQTSGSGPPSAIPAGDWDYVSGDGSSVISRYA